MKYFARISGIKKVLKYICYFTLKQHNSQTTKLNDLYFNLNQHIYACSDDGSILEWNILESKLVK